MKLFLSLFVVLWYFEAAYIVCTAEDGGLEDGDCEASFVNGTVALADLHLQTDRTWYLLSMTIVESVAASFVAVHNKKGKNKFRLAYVTAATVFYQSFTGFLGYLALKTNATFEYLACATFAGISFFNLISYIAYKSFVRTRCFGTNAGFCCAVSAILTLMTLAKASLYYLAPKKQLMENDVLLVGTIIIPVLSFLLFLSASTYWDLIKKPFNRKVDSPKYEDPVDLV
jgi:hypothetical protein